MHCRVKQDNKYTDDVKSQCSHYERRDPHIQSWERQEIFPRWWIRLEEMNMNSWFLKYVYVCAQAYLSACVYAYMYTYVYMIISTYMHIFPSPGHIGIKRPQSKWAYLACLFWCLTFLYVKDPGFLRERAVYKTGAE